MAGKLSRRTFLRWSSLAAGTLLADPAQAMGMLKPLPTIDNPLAYYPNRDWERIYRDQYRFDSSFTFVCVPNDTHNCRLRAYVRNGIVTRIEQAYDVHTYHDLDGNHMTAAWNPRGCLKGYTVHRRVYGPYRVKAPMVRAGWKAWVEAGFPDPSVPEHRQRYFQRGQDPWVRTSWDEAATLVAKAIFHIQQKYSGAAGAALLREQGYPDAMIEAMGGSGARTMKFRAGMWLLGLTRIGSLYRFANMLALLDANLRNVAPEQALGGRGWTNYDWHGDLPPGHPMVTGIQTFDLDISDFRAAKLMIFLGKNMVENKMPEAHWWIELIERGGKIVNISPEYSPASQKADYWVPIRPGTDTALLLGVAKILIDDKLYDEAFVKRFTDFPLLVRMDTLKLLKASDLIPGYQNAPLTGYSVQVQQIAPELREKWGDFVVWDAKTASPAPITREEVGAYLDRLEIEPVLEGTFRVATADGQEVEVKPVFQLYRELLAEYDLDTVAEITTTPKALIQRLAHDIGTIKPVMIHTGEGVNHYFHCDLTTRAVFLPLALTGNIGKPGANTGHWAGNYKTAVLPGLPVYIYEDPFAPDQGKVKSYMKPENVAYWNYGDRPLIVGGKTYTGKTHMPTPTKVIWAANVNLLNNAKWHYEMIANVDPKIEMIVYNEWEWTGSCEYADVVFPVHSWLEMTQYDLTASCSNPFLQIWKGGIRPLYDTKMDGEVAALVAAKLAELTAEPRFREYFRYFHEGRSEVYIQRILDASVTTSGYKVDDILAGKYGAPGAALMLFRTYPRIPGWEQIHESVPFYNKTGRMEFYRDEDEFIAYGENLIVHREPVEATPYLPNVIVGAHPAIRPVNDISVEAQSADERQVRNIKLPWREAKLTKNFLWEQGYRFFCLTPKTRHRVHSSWVVDWHIIWDSNFGDPYRMDKRTPWTGENQININPEDAKELGIDDGDYVYVDANPTDRPYVGWKPDDELYKVSRLLLRVKYNPAYPRGTTMIKHGSFMATHKTVRAHETRPDGMAHTEDTNYHAHLRYGSHQSLTRGWLQPTQMTDSLVRKEIYGQRIGEGYAPDIHSPNTCPKETLVRVIKAEDGGIGGRGKWGPGTTGYTPGNENETMRTYLDGGFMKT
ncbi:MAG TPA: molybdopterin-dependent oxidoreductase [Alphaproteobacteria bacterium]|nr:molybdopterin-dependent oxidoreductase [Alphaproteobacteria bacterium]